jgi:hypothetical protein
MLAARLVITLLSINLDICKLLPSIAHCQLLQICPHADKLGPMKCHVLQSNHHLQVSTRHHLRSCIEVTDASKVPSKHALFGQQALT